MTPEKTAKPPDFRKIGCRECLRAADLGFDFRMALQPIVNTRTGELFAQEALVRGVNGEPAGVVFESVNPGNRYRFDQSCRVKAIELAARLDIEGYLSINFMPNAVYRPELCIRTALAAAEEYGFSKDRIIFEITESEQVDDIEHLRNIIRHYQSIGFLTAIDDFGAGFSGLNLLADFRTDLVKLDLALVRDIDNDRARQAIVRGVLGVCEELGARVIAEGVETVAEWKCLEDMGIELFQGFLFARPAFEAQAEIYWPERS
ncbi:MAG: EAL domain-containing protein [Wenzhouxiangellaceae bacterium]|nr:EAL domain-containing protein [Wenzhouxiangellaceae bacterium]